MCYHILIFNNQEPPQAIVENVVEVPRLLTALNTTDEFRQILALPSQGYTIQHAGIHLLATASTPFKKKHLQQYGDTCHFNPILLISLHGKRSPLHLTIRSVGEGIIHVITGAVMLIYNLDQQTQLTKHCTMQKM